MTGGTCQASVCFGGTPELTFAPVDPAFFGTAREVLVTVTHAGPGAPIGLTGASIEPEGAFTVVLEPSWPTTLATSESAQLTVRLTAAAPGSHTATLNLRAATCADQPLALRGTVAPPAPPQQPEGGGCSCGLGAGGSGAILLALLAPWWRRGRVRRDGDE
jgi:hypothetical protein